MFAWHLSPSAFVSDELAAARSAASNTEPLRSAWLAGGQETKPPAFSAKPKGFLAATTLRPQSGLFSIAAKRIDELLNLFAILVLRH